MKVSNLSKQDFLKLMLILIVGINFLGNLGEHKGSATLFTTGPGEDDVKNGTDTAPPVATDQAPPLLPAPPAPGQAQPRTAEELAADAKKLGLKLSPLATGEQTPNPKLPAAGSGIPAAPSDQAGVVLCTVGEEDHAYDYVYAIGATNNVDVKTSLYAFSPKDKEHAHPKAVATVAGDANFETLNLKLKKKLEDKLLDLSENSDCVATPNKNVDVGVNTCENDAKGETLSEIAGMLCADDRTAKMQLTDSDGKKLVHGDLVEELQRMTDMMKDGLKSMLARECSDEKGRAYDVCNNGKRQTYITKATAALTHWLSRGKLDSSEKRKVTKMINSIKGMAVAERGEKEAERLKKKSDDIRDAIQSDESEIANDCQTIRPGDFQATLQCTDDKKKLMQDKADALDIYQQARNGGAGSQYSQLLALKGSMDYSDWAELTHEVRDPFMEVLNDLRGIDPHDAAWKNLLSADIRSIDQMAARSMRAMGDGAPTADDGTSLLGDRSLNNQRGTLPASLANLGQLQLGQLSSLQQLSNINVRSGGNGPSVNLAAGVAGGNPNTQFFGGGNTAGPMLAGNPLFSQNGGSPIAASYTVGSGGFGTRVLGPQGNGTVFGGNTFGGTTGVFGNVNGSSGAFNQQGVFNNTTGSSFNSSFRN